MNIKIGESRISISVEGCSGAGLRSAAVGTLSRKYRCASVRISFGRLRCIYATTAPQRMKKPRLYKMIQVKVSR